MTPSEFTIVERNLTRALITGDFELYKTLIHLPAVVVPRGGHAQEIRTDAELREDFDLYVQALQIQRATDIYRKILNFALMEDDWVEVTVETSILGSTGRIVEPFHTQFVLRPYGGRWQIVLVRSSFGHLRWTRGLARITPDGRFEDLHGEDGSVIRPIPAPKSDGEKDD